MKQHSSRGEAQVGQVILSFTYIDPKYLCPVVQSIVSLTSSLRVISLTVLVDSIFIMLKCFAEKMQVAFADFFSKKFQHIFVYHSM